MATHIVSAATSVRPTGCAIERADSINSDGSIVSSTVGIPEGTTVAVFQMDGATAVGVEVGRVADTGFDPADIQPQRGDLIVSVGSGLFGTGTVYAVGDTEVVVVGLPLAVAIAGGMVQSLGEQVAALAARVDELTSP